jgi:hypothetical protein
MPSSSSNRTSIPLVEIVREVNLSKLGWPDNSQASRVLGCNKNYVDFRDFSWEDAQRILSFECSLVSRIEDSDDPQAIYEEVVDELYDDDEGLLGLDNGIAAVVVSLSAAKCVPFTSCNGGFYGGHHLEYYPLVAFYARSQVVPALLDAATRANVGLTSESEIYVYSDKVTNMMAFVRALINIHCPSSP